MKNIRHPILFAWGRGWGGLEGIRGVEGRDKQTVNREEFLLP